MIKIIDLKEKNIFGIKVSGTFNSEDLNNIEADFLKITAECDEIMMYEDLTELQGISPTVIFSELVFLFKNKKEFDKIKKVAVISDKKWIRKAIEIEQLVDKKRIVKIFTSEDKDNIMGFLKGE